MVTDQNRRSPCRCRGDHQERGHRRNAHDRNRWRGHYQASGLPPGRFEIRAAKQGFGDEARTGTSLAVGQDAAVVDIKMQRGTPDPCTSGHEFATTDCTLTWHGIALFGAYDDRRRLRQPRFAGKRH